MGNKLKLFAAALALFAAFSGGYALARTKKPEIVSEIVASEPKQLEEIAFLDKDGETRKLSDFSGVRIINFWALWCFPCKQEMPGLSKLQQEYAGKGLKVVALANSSDGVKQIENFYKKNHINTLDIFIDGDNKNFKVFHLKGLPTSIIVNKNGEEVGHISGYNDWESKKTKAFIEKLLAE